MKLYRTVFFAAYFFGTFFIIAFSLNIHTAQASTAWYNTSWGYRTQITIDHTKVGNSNGSNLSFFPVLISTTSPVLKYTSSSGHVGKSNGGDILFTSADGVTKLNHEIESYASSTGNLIAWVQVPTVSTSTDTVIYAYYGNAAAADQQNATSTWNDGGNNNFKGVWHLANPTNPVDSLGVSNGTNHSVSATTGQIDGGGDFGNGVSLEYISTPTINHNIGTGDFTYSAWVFPTAYYTTISGATVTGILGNSNYSPTFFTSGNSGTGHALGYYWGGWQDFGVDVPLNTWSYVTMKRSSGVISGYINGTVGPTTHSLSSSMVNAGYVIGISGTSYFPDHFPGKIDDVRISSTARSADWIKTEFNNQNAPATFYTTANEEALTVPNAPTSLILTSGNTQIGLSWTAPVNTGNLTLTDYVVDFKATASSSWSTFADAVSTSTAGNVTGLINGTSYDFRVSAVNAVGQGDPSNVASATPATIPVAPTSISAVAGNANASVNFILTDNGGSAINYYTVTSNPGSITNTGAGAPITISGLTNGSSYTFTVTATNAVGTGPASTASNNVTPATTPGTPTAVSATAGNTQVALSWSAPASNGGTVITDYIIQYKLDASSTWSTFIDGTSTATSTIVTGLVNGLLYDFQIGAVNAVGLGGFSSQVSTTPFTIPDAPTSIIATRGNATSSVSFVAPTSNGGSTILSYTVTSNPGSQIGTGNTSPIVVANLINGTPYTFTVTATNAAGTGPASSPSNQITPATIPDAPTGLIASAGRGQVSLMWTVPGNNGGSIVTDYIVEYKLSTDSSWSTFADGVSSNLNATVIGLTNGSAYDFRVSAVNDVGQGSASVSASAMPVTVPDAPTIGTATTGNGQAVVTFTAPAFDGGSTVNSYTVTSSPGGFTGVGSVSPITVTGLTNGTSYTFTVTANNSVGTGSSSAPSNTVIPVTTPDAPISVIATPGNRQASIAFTSPASDGGTTITSYTVTSSPGGFVSTSNASPISVTGLTSGSTYSFTVTATNAVGTSS